MLIKPEDYKRKFSEDHVVKHTRVPSNPDDIPRIIGWSGPARSGSTALLFLLASHPEIARAYFQPQKTLMRKGGPEFVLRAEDSIVCMKEVFGGDGEVVGEHDPIGLLLKSGVPAENITWITMLREPVRTFTSILLHEPWVSDPSEAYCKTYIAAQRWSLHLFDHYRKKGVKMIPYVYDLARENEGVALQALLGKMNLDANQERLEFNIDSINGKLVPGQLADKDYFDLLVKDIFARRKYVYSNNTLECPPRLSSTITRACMSDYLAFRDLAQNELGLI